MRMTSGLFIADPWIGFVLDSAKDGGMRPSGTSHRCWFALPRKGARAIYEAARLVDAGAPLWSACRPLPAFLDKRASLIHEKITKLCQTGIVLC